MRTTWLSLLGFVALCAGTSASAVPLFTDGFDYPDGTLTTTSGNLWATYSGIANQIQVVDDKAVYFTRLGGNAGNPPTQVPIDEDVARSTNTTLAPGSTWFYATQFTITDNRTTPGTGTIGTEYFMNFKDDTIFNLRGRLFVTAGTNATTFKLGVTSSSTGLTANSTWADNLTFGQTYTAVVSYQASANDPRATISDGGNPPMQIPNPGFTGPLMGSDGYAKLWVDPVTSASTSVTDNMPPENVGTDLLQPMTSLVLRQGGSGTQTGSPPTSTSSVKFNVDTVSIGANFNEVLAAVTPSTGDDADFDGDGDVDGADFLTWQRGLGGPGDTADGDADGDNVVTGLDLAVWRAQFGLPAVPAVGAIPEPACLTLAALGMIGAVAAVRRRGR